ncbi:MAG: hypothetical protein KatS3mg057_0903 [Herpetosiphonaceae bacterium]|nr:MAG: hypothetical protein KatS3mg057_0903 [Herpetosiphonaceae bacterium]
MVVGVDKSQFTPRWSRTPIYTLWTPELVEVLLKKPDEFYSNYPELVRFLEERGGEAGLLAYCATRKLKDEYLETIQVHFEHVGAKKAIYAEALGISEQGYYYRMRELPKQLAPWLNSWLLPQEDEAASESAPPRPAPATAAPSAPLASNLPAMVTSLIGRERELDEVVSLIERRDVRLVTLTGPGGTGKTRLAIEVGQHLLDAQPALFPDGIFFIELAALRDPAFITDSILQALGIMEGGNQTIEERLIRYLRRKQLLLVLDNFEHLIAASSLITVLLREAASVKILITSREALRIYGEHEYYVPPLALPAKNQPLLLSELAQIEAIQLFVARAQASNSAFRLTEANAAAVVEICFRLDGLPLAIELAAARSKILPPEAMLPRLKERFHLLKIQMHDRPGRQKTLRGAIDWSYDLLSPSEQVVFAKLAIFSGGCSPEAAAAICDQTEFDILDSLSMLVDKSLLYQELGADRQPRFLMLETIHEYARERLAELGDQDRIYEKFVDYYLGLAEEVTPYLFKTRIDPRPYLSRLEVEHENFRTALAWLIQRSCKEEALRYCVALWPFWQKQGHLSEGLKWFAEALALPNNYSPKLQADAVYGSAVLAFDLSHYPHVKELCETCLHIQRAIGDLPGVAKTLTLLGYTVSLQGKYDEGIMLLQESLRLQRELGNEEGIALSLLYLGIVMRYKNEFEQAMAFEKESLETYRKLDDQPSCAWVLNQLAALALHTRDIALASRYCEESLAIQATLPVIDKRTRGFSLIVRGLVAFYTGYLIHTEQGDKDKAQPFYEQAVECHKESLYNHRDVGNKDGIAWNFMTLAWVGAMRMQATIAAHLLGAAEALCEQMSHPFSPAVQAQNKVFTEKARATMTVDAWDRLWHEGRAMIADLDEVILYALSSSF